MNIILIKCVIENESTWCNINPKYRIIIGKNSVQEGYNQLNNHDIWIKDCVC